MYAQVVALGRNGDVVERATAGLQCLGHRVDSEDHTHSLSVREPLKMRLLLD